MAKQHPVVAHAPAKLNLFFEVGPVGGDGYHEVVSFFQALALKETVSATPLAAGVFEVTVSGDGVDVSQVPLDDANLALRAARLLAERYEVASGVSLAISKQVPVAAGLGGGSADAAAALIACNELWGLGLSRDVLQGLGAELGADVPFAVLAGTLANEAVLTVTAVGTGRGDKVKPVVGAASQHGWHWVLQFSETGLRTPDVYHEYDLLVENTGANPINGLPDEFLSAFNSANPHVLAKRLRNDLSQATLALRPELAADIEFGLSNGALAGIIAGSGPTVAFLAATPHEAKHLEQALKAKGAAALRVDAAKVW